VKITDRAPESAEGLVSIVTHKAAVYIPLSELVDFEKELQRIEAEREKAEKGLQIVESKLKNEKFVANAPESVVNAEREKAAKYREFLAKLEESAKAMHA